MTRVEEKRQRRKAIFDANNEIYKNIVSYLTGPKWNGTKYQIGDLMSKSSAFGIIKVDTGYLGCRCSIYFNRNIHLYITYRHHGGYEEHIDYDYFSCNTEYDDLPEDMDDYIYRAKTFLKELLRHLTCLDGYEISTSTHITSYDECVDIAKPENFSVPFGIIRLLTYEFYYTETETIDYMIAVLKSKKFKRYRGDNR